jgi:hypothetical protein
MSRRLPNLMVPFRENDLTQNHAHLIIITNNRTQFD